VTVLAQLVSDGVNEEKVIESFLILLLQFGSFLEIYLELLKASHSYNFFNSWMPLIGIMMS